MNTIPTWMLSPSFHASPINISASTILVARQGCLSDAPRPNDSILLHYLPPIVRKHHASFHTVVTKRASVLTSEPRPQPTPIPEPFLPPEVLLLLPMFYPTEFRLIRSSRPSTITHKILTSTHFYIRHHEKPTRTP